MGNSKFMGYSRVYGLFWGLWVILGFMGYSVVKGNAEVYGLFWGLWDILGFMGYSVVKGNAEVYEDLEIYGNFDIMRKFVVTKHS